jgi:hypothetical protein
MTSWTAGFRLLCKAPARAQAGAGDYGCEPHLPAAEFFGKFAALIVKFDAFTL